MKKEQIIDVMREMDDEQKALAISSLARYTPGVSYISQGMIDDIKGLVGYYHVRNPEKEERLMKAFIIGFSNLIMRDEQIGGGDILIKGLTDRGEELGDWKVSFSVQKEATVMSSQTKDIVEGLSKLTGEDLYALRKAMGTIVDEMRDVLITPQEGYEQFGFKQLGQIGASLLRGVVEEEGHARLTWEFMKVGDDMTNRVHIVVKRPVDEPEPQSENSM